MRFQFEEYMMGGKHLEIILYLSEYTQKSFFVLLDNHQISENYFGTGKYLKIVSLCHSFFFHSGKQSLLRKTHYKDVNVARRYVVGKKRNH